MERYTYKPVDAGRHELRLISLQPGEFSDDVKIEIVNVLLAEDNPPYCEALSYVWGSTENPSTIYVRDGEWVDSGDDWEDEDEEPADQQKGFDCSIGDRLLYSESLSLTELDSLKSPEVSALESQSVKGNYISSQLSSHQSLLVEEGYSYLTVTQNLYVALKHLRRKEDNRIIWIDAICINQTPEEDDMEKGIDVARMGTIYKKASLVVIWLGPEADNSSLGIETLRSLGQDVKYDPRSRVLEPKFLFKYNPIFIVPDVDRLRSKEILWLAILGLVRRDWFTRLWVYQEVQLSRNATVVVGHSEIPLFDFALGLRCFSASSRGWDTYFSTIFDQDALLNAVATLWSEEESETTHNFFSILGYTRNKKCYDARDRVYAILSLLKEPEFLKIIPNYKLPVEQVYTEFAGFILQAIPNLGILSVNQMSHSRKLYVTFPVDTSPSPDAFRILKLQSSNPILTLKFSSNLPSWVPDLSVSGPTYQFAGEASGLSFHNAELLSDGRILRLQGKFIEVVSEVLREVPQDVTESEMITILRSWMPPDLIDMEQLNDDSVRYVRGGSLLDAFLISFMIGEIEEISSSKGFPSLRECHEGFSHCFLDQQSDARRRIIVNCLRKLRRRAFFKGTNGLIGLCPPATEPGDQIYVLLGYERPIVVRQVLDRNEHLFVGDCYAHGIMYGEGLFGDLQPGWERVWRIRQNGDRTSLFSLGGMETQEDPRVTWPLERPWSQRFWDTQDGKWYETDFNESGQMRVRRFVNSVQKKDSRTDPRLTRESLAANGITSQDLDLV